MNFAERLKKARKLAGLTQEQLAKKVGLSQQAIGGIEKGKNNATGKTVEIAVACGVNPTWLANGDGPMLVGGVDTAKLGLRPIALWSSADDLPSDEYVIVPRLEMVFSAGNGGPTARPDPVMEQGQAFRSSYIKRKRLKPAGLFSGYATGDSMEPRIMDGDTLLIDTSQKEVLDGKVYALVFGDDHELRVKRLFKLPGGGLLIRSDNKENYPEIRVESEQAHNIHIVGRVVHASGDV